MNEIVALYKFAYIENPASFQKNLKTRLKELKIYGTILVGREGINGTISSESIESLSEAISFIESHKGLKNLDLKFSQSNKRPFIRLKVKLKKEIVTIGDTSINPNELVGKHVESKDWNDLIKDKDTLIIDTRNIYECSIGTFKNSINPSTEKFRDFPKWVKDQNIAEDNYESSIIELKQKGLIK